MARAALEHLGGSVEDIDRAEIFYRKNDRERLEIETNKGDLRAARERMITEPRRNWAEAGSEI
jgi:CPA2 family monovalent cation:H+ antiporter-2/glutathione-regulated potassium-efflux system protein KefB